MDAMAKLEKKTERLRKIVRSFGSAAVAFSGGTDSTLVAKVAHDELGPKAVAFTIDSPLYPGSELHKAEAASKKIGIEHVVLRTDPMCDDAFVANPPDRCYLCKLEDLGTIKKVANRMSLKVVADGSNADDSKDYRPGLKAKRQLGVRSPLAEAKLTKEEVRAISRSLRLPTADKKASPCLASRIPYGEKITREKLKMIEEAEEFLSAKGFEDVRVRLHNDIARIEIAAKDIPRLAAPGTRISVSRRLRALGFAYVTLDLEGYRMGSLNEVLRR